MAAIFSGLFGGGGGAGQTWLPQPTTNQSPDVPLPNSGASTASGNAARIAAALQIGRSATILEDYGKATQASPARAFTLGAST